MSDSAGEVVREFTRAMRDGELDRALDDLATDDIVFENVPMQPPAQVVSGREIVRSRLAALYEVGTAERFDIVHQIEDGDVVMHERIDSFRFPPGTFPKGDVFAMRVASVFTVRDGRVASWRDYYDLGVFEIELGVDLAEFGRIVGHRYAESRPS
ncbi:limonene-1,2-epoxide hydrolase family protein [Nocardia sp. CA-135953]|uniref:limonene-1,2-epoxide hydrolase family protein n=1 Tax=Nocardia sp. CA-135953 TaxID=3239978 RepID=UPI003D98373C